MVAEGRGIMATYYLKAGEKQPTLARILKRMAEWREIGRDAFLQRYAAGRGAKTHMIVHNGIQYDLKALWGAAHHPPVLPSRFNPRTARAHLRALGLNNSAALSQAAAWRVLFTTSSGMRKQFTSWKIPTDIMKRHRIKDGQDWMAFGHSGIHSFALPIRVTSGGEFRLPVRDAATIAAIAKSSPTGGIEFSLGRLPSQGESLEDFEARVRKAMKNKTARRKRLEKAPKIPQKRFVIVLQYDRNSDVVAEVRSRAKGVCEGCKESAPFKRRRDQEPYLEVHHIRQLAHGGKDEVANAIALCPNCHRQAHYGWRPPRLSAPAG